METCRLQLEDLDSYFSLRIQSLEEFPTAFGMSAPEELKRGKGFFETILSSSGDANVVFGAFSGATLVGVIGVLQTGRTKTNHKASIWGMYVAPSARGQGVAGKLLDVAIAHAREKMSASGVYLAVESANVAAKKLYESRGFVRWGTEPRALRVDGAYYDEDHMSLQF